MSKDNQELSVLESRPHPRPNGNWAAGPSLPLAEFPRCTGARRECICRNGKRWGAGSEFACGGTESLSLDGQGRGAWVCAQERDHSPAQPQRAWKLTCGPRAGSAEPTPRSGQSLFILAPALSVFRKPTPAPGETVRGPCPGLLSLWMDLAPGQGARPGE